MKRTIPFWAIQYGSERMPAPMIAFMILSTATAKAILRPCRKLVTRGAAARSPDAARAKGASESREHPKSVGLPAGSLGSA
eukprot:scaffold13444_cov30-Tisochrysis_lutea.AAC.3